MTIWTDASEFRAGDIIVASSGLGRALKTIRNIEVYGSGSVRLSTFPGEAVVLHPRGDQPIRFERYRPERLIAMRNLAEMKRAIHGGTVNTDGSEGPGTKVLVRNWVYPALSGVREVLIARSTQWCLSFPDGHPRQSDGEGSWLDVPSASRCTFVDNACTIMRDPEWGDLTPFCTIEILET